MVQRIRTVTVRPIRLTPTEAVFAVKIETDASAGDAEVHGRLTGPRCKYSTTIDVAYPIRRLPGSSGGLIGRVIIPEPSWWDPESPFLYSGLVELWHSGQTIDAVRVRGGLYHASAAGGRLIWNGRPLDVHAAVEPGLTAAQLPAVRAAGTNLVVVDADELLSLCDAADEVGILLAGRAADARARAVGAPPFEHPSLLGFVDESDGGGSLVLSGGREALAFDVR
jgi:hypothetical protein